LGYREVQNYLIIGGARLIVGQTKFKISNKLNSYKNERTKFQQIKFEQTEFEQTKFELLIQFKKRTS
jgi:hypothetical protein